MMTPPFSDSSVAQLGYNGNSFFLSQQFIFSSPSGAGVTSSLNMRIGPLPTGRGLTRLDRKA
jgi:hypothetical protein